MKKVAIIGAGGFTGHELLRLLAMHGKIEITLLTSDEYENMKINDVYKDISLDKKFISHRKSLNHDEIDLVFVALPSPFASFYVNEFFKKKIKVIDLSGDSRFKNPEDYEKWYKKKHAFPEYLKSTAYGIPELFEKEIKKARVIANPGCYPTSIIIPLYPLCKEDLVDGCIIVDSKSGVSGAGKKIGERTHFLNVYGNFFEYNVGREHRHVGEMENILKKNIVFTPGVLPLSRGILSTIYVRVKEKIDLSQLYGDYYRGKEFVHITEHIPSIKEVVFTNNIKIGFKFIEDLNLLIIVSCIDNLLKGASGQAVQNMNLIFEFKEDDGLPKGGVGI